MIFVLSWTLSRRIIPSLPTLRGQDRQSDQQPSHSPHENDRGGVFDVDVKNPILKGQLFQMLKITREGHVFRHSVQGHEMSLRVQSEARLECTENENKLVG